MSRREAVIKAAAGALNPKNLDLTKFRQQSSRERRINLKTDEAAMALAYGAEGDLLPRVLLRFKYVDQMSREAFTYAHLMLLRRHGWDDRHPSETLFAVAYAAIFEWSHDSCAECRGARPVPSNAARCPVCKPTQPAGKFNRARRDEITFDSAKKPGVRVTAAIAVPSPEPGCPKCGGTGRFFPKERQARGMTICKPCGNSGRRTFRFKERWSLVNEYLVTAQVRREEKPRGIDIDTFRNRWIPRYNELIRVLRATDKSITAGIDLGMEASPHGGQDPEPLDFLEHPDAG